MKRDLGTWVVGCAIAAGVIACTDTHPPPGDKNTNWLAPCAASNECGGGLDCIADVCTRACDSLEDCNDPELALQCAAGVCAAKTPVPGDSGVPTDAADPTKPMDTPKPLDASVPQAGAGGSGPMDAGVACNVSEKGRRPGPNRYSRDVSAPGCSGTNLGNVIAAIHTAYPDLADINYLFDPDSPPPPVMLSNMITAFGLEDGFAIVMQRGMGDCESGCTAYEYWYFRTDDSCAPKQVGHYRPQSYEASCMLQGYPMWDTPVPPADLHPACGLPVRAKYLSSEYAELKGCGHRMPCTGPGASQTRDAVTLELQVQIDRDDAEPSTGTVTLQGTGQELLDGRPLPATFEGGVVRVSDTESLPSTCLEQFTIDLVLDFDGNIHSHMLYEESRTPDCASGGDYCKGSLQLDFGRVLRNAACFADEDVSTAIGSAQARLLACENDDDCTTISLATSCIGGCQGAVRADKADELRAVVEQAENYCFNAGCSLNPSCPAMHAVCDQGKCTTAVGGP